MPSTFTFASLVLVVAAACTTEEPRTTEATDRAPVIESLDLEAELPSDRIRIRAIISAATDLDSVDGILLDDTGTALGSFDHLDGAGAFALELATDDLRPSVRSLSGVRTFAVEFYDGSGNLARRELEVAMGRLPTGRI